MRHVTELTCWEVTLVDRQTVEVWADSYQELDGAYVFAVLADVNEDQQKDLLILGRTPSNSERVIVGLSRFPREAVAKIRSGGGPRPLSD